MASHLVPIPSCNSGAKLLKTVAEAVQCPAAGDSGLRAARAEGFTHVLTMDADGQHDAASIGSMMALSRAHPDAMILGQPVFDASAPLVRVLGRRLSNFWVDVETLWGGIGGSLFGFRVYPIAPLLEIFETTRWMRRFDFDPEAAVRLDWRGVPAINLRTPVRYWHPDQGVSHFSYLMIPRLASSSASPRVAPCSPALAAA